MLVLQLVNMGSSPVDRASHFYTLLADDISSNGGYIVYSKC